MVNSTNDSFEKGVSFATARHFLCWPFYLRECIGNKNIPHIWSGKGMWLLYIDMPMCKKRRAFQNCHRDADQCPHIGACQGIERVWAFTVFSSVLTALIGFVNLYYLTQHPKWSKHYAFREFMLQFGWVVFMKKTAEMDLKHLLCCSVARLSPKGKGEQKYKKH